MENSISPELRAVSKLLLRSSIDKTLKLEGGAAHLEGVRERAKSDLILNKSPEGRLAVMDVIEAITEALDALVDKEAVPDWPKDCPDFDSSTNICPVDGLRCEELPDEPYAEDCDPDGFPVGTFVDSCCEDDCCCKNEEFWQVAPLTYEAERVLQKTIYNLGLELVEETTDTITVEGRPLSALEENELAQAAWGCRADIISASSEGSYLIGRLIVKAE